MQDIWYLNTLTDKRGVTSLESKLICDWDSAEYQLKVSKGFLVV
jgi:hypothetical protein